MRLHLSPMTSEKMYSSFSSQFIPPVKHSSILKYQLHQKKFRVKNIDDSSETIKPFVKSKNNNSPVQDVKDDDFIVTPKRIEKTNFSFTKERKISDPSIEIPTIESQDKFFSIGEKIESNDKKTEEFFKREPQFILKVTRNATDVLSEWDTGYLNYFVCDILGPNQHEIEGNECGILIPIETMHKAAKRIFEEEDILIVETPYHVIKHTDPPLLIAPVIYLSPENWRLQH